MSFERETEGKGSEIGWWERRGEEAEAEEDKRTVVEKSKTLTEQRYEGWSCTRQPRPLEAGRRTQQAASSRVRSSVQSSLRKRSASAYPSTRLGI